MKTMLLMLSMVFVFILSACGEDDYLTTGPRGTAYEDLPHISDYRGLEAYDEEDTMYLLYIYATWCGACQAILLDVLDFVDQHDETIPIVFAEEGANGTPPVEWSYYPSMIVMQSGEVLEGPIVGPSDILQLFDALEANTYEP